EVAPRPRLDGKRRAMAAPPAQVLATPGRARPAAGRRGVAGGGGGPSVRSREGPPDRPRPGRGPPERRPRLPRRRGRARPRAAAAGGPLQTFSGGFREGSFSELPYAGEVARRYGTRHVEQVVTPDAVSLLDELTRFYDEPFADSSAVPTFLVARLASRSVKVA